jgi:1,4-dihydroxy-2-naphthoate octaprenyltransferase
VATVTRGQAIAAAPEGAAAPEPMPGWRAWLLAARPRTLAVSVGPVAVGSAVAASEGGARAGPALAALLGALLLQVGSNFANDVFDFEKGADTEARIGPARAAQLGLLSPRQMRIGTALAFAGAALVGLYLIGVAGWPVAAVGAVSILAALAYSGGPWPFGYHGLGDPAVFLFFGVVAVVGTDYVQTLAFSWRALAASLPVGALATAILVVNNVRDIETDASGGKRTLAVRLGRRGGRIEYAALVLGSYAMLLVFWVAGRTSPFVLAPWLTLPWALSLVRTLSTRGDGPSLNAALAGTAQLGLVFSLLFGLGLLR